MPFIYIPHTQETHYHSNPPWIICIYLAIALLRIIYDYLEYRENLVDKYLDSIRNKIDEKNRRELQHLPGGNEYDRLEWDWRTAAYFTIPKKTMVHHFWRPLRNNIPPKLRNDLGI